MIERPDAETETLLRTCDNSLFRAAGLEVRVFGVGDAAINSFVGTGNRMFTPGDPPGSQNRKED